MTDNDIIQFGIHKGKKMIQVPASYLIMLHNSGKCFGNVKQYIEDNLETLRLEVKQGLK